MEWSEKQRFGEFIRFPNCTQRPPLALQQTHRGAAGSLNFQRKYICHILLKLLAQDSSVSTVEHTTFFFYEESLVNEVFEGFGDKKQLLPFKNNVTRQ